MKRRRRWRADRCTQFLILEHFFFLFDTDIRVMNFANYLFIPSMHCRQSGSNSVSDAQRAWADLLIGVAEWSAPINEPAAESATRPRAQRVLGPCYAAAVHSKRLYVRRFTTHMDARFTWLYTVTPPSPLHHLIVTGGRFWPQYQVSRRNLCDSVANSVPGNYYVILAHLIPIHNPHCLCQWSLYV